MSTDVTTAERWNQRYHESVGAAASACYALIQYQHLLPKSGKALELACGRGGNALFLAALGFDTSAWDISSVVIDLLQTDAGTQGLALNATVRDCVAKPPDHESFDIIVVSRFLERQLFAALSEALRPDGVLFYQTFTDKNIGGPRNPDFLLQENELLQAFPSLSVRVFEDCGLCGDTDAGFRHESLIVAQKTSY